MLLPQLDETATPQVDVEMSLICYALDLFLDFHALFSHVLLVSVLCKFKGLVKSIFRP